MSEIEKIPTIPLMEGEKLIETRVKEFLAPFEESLMVLQSDEAKTKWLQERRPELTSDQLTAGVIQLKEMAEKEIARLNPPGEVNPLLRQYYFVYFAIRYGIPVVEN